MAVTCQGSECGLCYWPDTNEWLSTKEFMERFYEKYPDKRPTIANGRLVSEVK